MQALRSTPLDCGVPFACHAGAGAAHSRCTASAPEVDLALMDDDDEGALRAKVFAQFDALAKTVGAGELRRALAASFMICASSQQRRAYDQLREEIDAFLRAGTDGEARVQRPEGFVESPEVTDADVASVAASVLGRDRDRPKH